VNYVTHPHGLVFYRLYNFACSMVSIVVIIVVKVDIMTNV
jgi:hypothetical protein